MLSAKRRLDIPADVRDDVRVTLPSRLPPEALADAARAGLDILVPCVAQRYNRLIAGHERLRPIETFGHQRTSALLVGNTRALWPALKRAVAERPDLLERDPVDRHVEATVRALQANVAGRTEVYFGHDMGQGMVSMLHAVEASGFADRGPAHLAVHPLHGPWFALRALVVIDQPAVHDDPVMPRLCAPCHAPCVAALERAVDQSEGGHKVTGLGASWRAWVAVRDVCPVGQSARYGDAQIRYHYAGDDAGLRSSRAEQQT
jgi:methylmalonic aciduria homocystinuria type C protein